MSLTAVGAHTHTHGSQSADTVTASTVHSVVDVVGCILLCSDLDELLQQLHSLVQRHTHEHLGHDPLLDFVTPLQ